MVAIVSTVAYLGLEARAVEVQVQLASGLPRFTIVGLPDNAVRESRERVRAAMASIGLALPPKVITINLSPADLPKEGSHFDLPIALGLLAAIGATDSEGLSHYVAVGELSLDGRIAASPGVLLAALHASGEGKGLICPVGQGAEAAWAGDVEVLIAASRKDRVQDLLNLHDVYRALLKARNVRGAVDFETTETQIICDENGRIEQIVPRVRNDAHKLIEEAMLDVMYELPEMEHKGKHVITAEVVRGERKLGEKKPGKKSA